MNRKHYVECIKNTCNALGFSQSSKANRMEEHFIYIFVRNKTINQTILFCVKCFKDKINFTKYIYLGSNEGFINFLDYILLNIMNEIF